MRTISEIMRAHYSQKFDEHGPTAKGVDWGREADVTIRYQNMLELLHPAVGNEEPVSLLDVGCGYGGLYQYSKELGIPLTYTGVDLCGNMIAFAQKEFPEAQFYHMDFCELPTEKTYDYVVCNGILTQKLTVDMRDMESFSNTLIKRMFQIARCGVAFNVMTTHVNFMVENLYYRNPVELLDYCFSEITKKVKLNHAYPLYEYTVYLYHE